MTMIIIVAMVMFLGYCRAPMAFGQESKVIHVQNFGKPMSPGLPPYRNDPEGIVLSENFYSMMPGSRELRSGYSDFIPYTSVDDTVTAPIDALGLYSPQGDSSGLIFAAGGFWYSNIIGRYNYASGGYSIDRNPNDSIVTEITPYTPGKITVDTTTLKVLGTGISRFIRDLEPNDSIISSENSALRYQIDYIVDDSVLFIKTTSNDSMKGADDFYARRQYTDAANVKPYLHASDGYMYTGTSLDQPQIIYNLNGTRHIRRMGIVDSFLIDTVYTLYPPRLAPHDSNRAADFARWDSVDTYPHKSWDTTIYLDASNGHNSIWSYEFMLVNRRKAGEWTNNQWVESITENPEAYYLRIGAATSPNTGTFFQIKWNDDTAIAVHAWYVDSAAITDAGDAQWNDSIFSGFGTDMNDTIKAADVDGKWAYIYSAAGFHDVIVTDAQTNVVTVLGRGSMFYTDDSSFPIDTNETHKGMLFIHLTGNDIDFPADTNQQTRFLNQYTLVEAAPFGDVPIPRVGDTLLSDRNVWGCKESDLYSGSPDMYYSIESAIAHCRRDQSPVPGIEYTFSTIHLNRSIVAAQVVGNEYFPIRYMRRSGDITYFITNIDKDLTSIVTDTTSNWEVVRVDLPAWSGMTEWSNPNQLIAWGDTLSPGLLSFSGFNDPWNWSANNDVLLGGDFTEPVISVAGYDGNVIVFKPHEMIGFDGNRFKQISASDGLVAPGAVLRLANEIYWLDADGPKKMKRRDFSGYSIEKLGSAMDPVFNSWLFGIYGTDVAPVIMTPASKSLALMDWNKRENKIYLFFAADGNATNNRVATFDMNKQMWDGILTISAAAVISAQIDDTLRLIIGDPATAKIFALDYAFNDEGVGIDGQLTSAKFYLTDARGFPMKSKLGMIQFHYRTNKEVDTLELELIGDNATTVFYPEAWRGFSPVTDFTDTFRPSTENVSMFWQWDIDHEATNAGGIFIPYDLWIELIPVERND